MIKRFSKYIFGLYEQPRLRNWFYTLAFAIFVPTGLRFSIHAWRYGAWFDKPLAIIAGTAIGITATVTLLRIWKVPPRQTVNPAHESEPLVLSTPEIHSDVLSASRWQAGRNKQWAREAATLGSTRRTTRGVHL